jgi:hypothetical protein
MDLRGVGLPSLASVLIDSWSASDSVNDAWRARFWANFKVCSSMLFLVELAALVFLVAAKICIKYMNIEVLFSRLQLIDFDPKEVHSSPNLTLLSHFSANTTMRRHSNFVLVLPMKTNKTTLKSNIL